MPRASRTATKAEETEQAVNSTAETEKPQETLSAKITVIAKTWANGSMLSIRATLKTTVPQRITRLMVSADSKIRRLGLVRTNSAALSKAK